MEKIAITSVSQRALIGFFIYLFREHSAKPQKYLYLPRGQQYLQRFSQLVAKVPTNSNMEFSAELGTHEKESGAAVLATPTSLVSSAVGQ
jgi:hypothetical protein